MELSRRAWSNTSSTSSAMLSSSCMAMTSTGGLGEATGEACAFPRPPPEFRARSRSASSSMLFWTWSSSGVWIRTLDGEKHCGAEGEAVESLYGAFLRLMVTRLDVGGSGEKAGEFTR